MCIFELCVYGDLFFFENSFSKTELSLIKDGTEKYFKIYDKIFDITEFIQYIRKETNLNLIYYPITAGIAI